VEEFCPSNNQNGFHKKNLTYYSNTLIGIDYTKKHHHR
jgi:hypothetical protein